ncbi:MAG: amidase [Sphingomonas bacterium]|nr:amidase [Sphingomonas bacterium]MDB5719286.1 amidase [Sphingomonas bacterium]
MLKSMKRLICSMALIAISVISTPATAQYLQCAPFAREASGIQLFGNAATWWGQASGKYDRGDAPKLGAVLVFKATGAMRVGHVAMVSQIVSDREIKLTHANWSVINGRRGQIERDVTAIDVSSRGDWSEVRVWYAPIRGLGTKSYPVYGFVYSGKSQPRIQLASADTVRGPAGLFAAAGTRTLLP